MVSSEPWGLPQLQQQTLSHVQRMQSSKRTIKKRRSAHIRMVSRPFRHRRQRTGRYTAKEATKLPLDEPFLRTLIQARARYRKRAGEEWREEYATHAGNNTLILKSNGRQVSPSMANPCQFIEATDNNISFLTGFVRALTNHAPTGEYRWRWHPEAETECRHDESTHTRIHILTECRAYKRSFTSMRDLIYYEDSLREFIKFLKRNPRAFSFEDAPHKPP